MCVGSQDSTVVGCGGYEDGGAGEGNNGCGSGGGGGDVDNSSKLVRIQI